MDASRKTSSGREIFRTLSEETDGLYSLIELLVDPGDGPPPHTHTRESECFLVIEGKFQIRVGDDPPVDLEKDGFAYGPRGIVHSFQNVGEGQGRLLLVVTPGGFEGFFRDLDEARANPGPDLLERERAIDAKYGLLITRNRAGGASGRDDGQVA
jgi:mannose-6-phosphate isomerase-like protein (cupin superfamily)